MPEVGTKQLMQKKARTFFLASRLLPKQVRGDVETLYKYFRSVDDLVDEPDGGDVRQALAEVERDVNAERPALPMIQAVRSVVDRYSIPPALLTEVLRGARADIDHSTPATFDDLYAYADLVAGSVGATLCHILGAVSTESLLAARYLGVAMQLTNILRDVGEDLSRQRIYIPIEDMTRFEYSETDLATHVVDDRFRALMRFEIYRANQFYCAGINGIQFLNPRSRPAIQMAATLYGRILRKIEQSDFDVFEKRAAVHAYEKLLSLPTALVPGQPRVPSPHIPAMEPANDLGIVSGYSVAEIDRLSRAPIAVTPLAGG
jgi:phytoene synthase